MKNWNRHLMPHSSSLIPLLACALLAGTFTPSAHARPNPNAQLAAEEAQFASEQIALRQMQIEMHNMQVAQNRSQRQNKNNNQSNNAQAAFLHYIAQALALTAQQQGQVNTVLSGAGRKFNAINRNTALTPTAHDDQMGEEGDKMWSQIEAILTPDQLVKLDQHRQAELLANMVKALGLTSDQQTQVKVLFTAELATDTQIRNDGTLSPDDAKTKLKLARGDSWTGIKALLTTAQHEDLDKLDLDAEVTYLRRSLALTDDEQTKIKPILQDNQKSSIAIALDPVVDRGEQADKREALTDDMWVKIEALLTPVQLRKLQSQQGEELQGDLTAALALTSAQQASLKPVVRTLETRLHADRVSATLTPDAKKAKLKADHSTFKTNVEALLTADQLPKFEEWLNPAPKPVQPKTVVAREVAVR